MKNHYLAPHEVREIEHLPRRALSIRRGFSRTNISIFLCLITIFVFACVLPGWGEQQTENIVVNDPTVNALETAIAPKITFTQVSEVEIQPSMTFLPATDVSTATINAPTAPEATPIPDFTATPASSACLVGTWQITNLQDYVLAAIPPEMIQEYQPTYKSTSGQAYVKFSNDGTVTIQTSQLEIRFDVKAGAFSVELTVRVDGTANGLYQADASQLSTSDMNTSGMTASAKVLGQSVLDETQIISAIPLVQPPFNTATYQCGEQGLALRLVAYPENVPALNFQRVP